ncbi:hypothetical protein [Mycolicibacter virginiensis]|uniref:hypothetical protein n=1 Tax=Mycolicibacter virginiensis TaxID=1795032 RepID=UPI001F03A41C|nr:hypothetical protein [Mycolicibacter virginiensis]ULP47890.1 hypothetical protein MJO54_01580 [Mycolicibacter virginiensis]
MYDPQADDATQEAEAIGATVMAPTAPSDAGSGVVDAFAWSQEDGSAGAEPVPYVPFAEDPYYDQDLSTGRRSTVSVPAAPIPGRRAPSRLPRVALIVGIVVALVAVAGALYSLTRGQDDETPVVPETSAVAPPTPTPSTPPRTGAPAPPPVATTSAPPPQTTTEPPPPPTTTTAPPTTTTTPPPTSTTTTTTAPPTPTTTPPTTTVPPTTSEPPSTTVPPTTTVPMTTEYLRIPLVPIPIPITVPQN